MDWNMQMVAICQEMGWTYNEFLDTPIWFIDLIREKLNIDAQNQANAAKQNKKPQN